MSDLTTDEIKSLVVSWCDSLLKNGVYSIDNYNECLESLNTDTNISVDEKLEIPRTGMEHNYGLYNRKKTDLKKRKGKII